MLTAQAENDVLYDTSENIEYFCLFYGRFISLTVFSQLSSLSILHSLD